MPGPPARSRRTRRLGLLATLIVAATTGLLVVRAAVAEVFLVPTARVAPEIPPGSRVLVSKLARTFAPGDIVAYRVPDAVRLGRVERTDPGPPRTLTLSANAHVTTVVRLDDVVGRVVVNSR